MTHCGDRELVERTLQEQLLADKLVEARQALPPDVDRDVRFDAYADLWIKQQTANGLAPGTVANYEQMLALYVRPAFGWHRVRDLHRSAIRRWLTALRDRGLSKNTTRLARAALSSLLSDAVEEGILANPTFGMGRKKRGPHRLSQTEREERIRPLTEEELPRFLTTADLAEPRIAPYFWTMALQGSRPGEALALQARDIDFDELSLTIERAVDKRGHVGAPKDGERRTVDLHSRLVPVLKRVIREQKEESLKHGKPWDDSAYLFATRTGKPLDLANVARAFKRVLRKMTPEGQKAARHSLYDLRHTFATLLLAGPGDRPPGAHHVRCRPDGARQSGDDLALLRPVDSQAGSPVRRGDPGHLPGDRCEGRGPGAVVLMTARATRRAGRLTTQARFVTDRSPMPRTTGSWRPRSGLDAGAGMGCN
jgi:integrase